MQPALQEDTTAVFDISLVILGAVAVLSVNNYF